MAEKKNLISVCISFLVVQVEGVSEFVHSSFQLLLEIYCLECKHFEDPKRPLYEQFLQRIILMPWQVKARYFPLCAVLPYVGTEKVRKHAGDVLPPGQRGGLS